jgi:branched-chain amino acid transport system substrate-binding protein
LMKKYFGDEPLGFISLESFLAAKSVVGALKNIDGSITREKFLKEIKKLPNNILDGVDINYKNNQLHNKVYLFKYKNSKFIEVNNEN